MNEQLEYRLGEIEDEKRVLTANIRQLQAKIGELCNEAWGIRCEIVREQHADTAD